MSDFYLIRHGSNDWLGKGIAGRMSNVHLNAKGRVEAERLSEVLAPRGIKRILSSPLERARETAEPLSRSLGQEIEISEEILEIDFGDWNGKTFEELNSSENWRLFNSYRSGTRIPNGETMLEVQSRMIAALEKWHRAEPDGVFALFSHGDPIKLVIAYCLGIPLDLFTRIEISPGSFSLVRLEEWGPQLLCANNVPS